MMKALPAPKVRPLAPQNGQCCPDAQSGQADRGQDDCWFETGSFAKTMQLSCMVMENFIAHLHGIERDYVEAQDCARAQWLQRLRRLSEGITESEMASIKSLNRMEHKVSEALLDHVLDRQRTAGQLADTMLDLCATVSDTVARTDEAVRASK